ncbi:MAG TPA: DUF2281 domain-containing protein [Methanoregulaceae archaeon]|nr:DUF2281 domain-containing protein [Methanoregulaceae archaeon]
MLEEKIARLPPTLRREVEDFVDFLIRRHDTAHLKGTKTSAENNPIILAEERHIPYSEDLLPIPANTSGMEAVYTSGKPKNDDLTGEQCSANSILEWIE